MAHFRTMLTSDNFCAADLWSEQGQRYAEIDVEIVEIKRGEVIGDKGRKKGMPFLTMRSVRTGQIIPKPLGLNATNCNTIASLAGSPDVRKWIGLLISLFVTKTEMGRETRDAIRIKPELAKKSAPADKPKDEVTPGKVEESLKREGLIDETSKDRNDRLEREQREEGDRRKATAERAIGRELSGNDQLSEADMRAIELAEAEEAKRRG